jgi:hypothetical protein
MSDRGGEQPTGHVAIPAAPAALLGDRLQAGNYAVSRFVRGLSASRSGTLAVARDPVPAAPVTPAAPAAATGDILKDALAELRASSELVDRNTAQAIDEGTMKVRYLDDLALDPKSDDLLDGWGFDKTKYAVRMCPSGERRVIQRNAEGSAHHDCGTSWLFVAKTVSVSRMRELLVHETNHAMRLDEGTMAAADSFDRYKDEFQAYWVAEFRGVKDLDDRAKQIRAHILADYPALGARHGTDAKFAALVDAHTRPDGNVLNSLRWKAIEEAVAGLGTDEDTLFAALRALSPEERAATAANADLVERVRDDLSGDDLLRANLLMAGAGKHAEAAIDAMSGLGTDEDALYAALTAMDPTERALVRANAAFIERLKDDLSGEELERALTLVGAK